MLILMPALLHGLQSTLGPACPEEDTVSIENLDAIAALNATLLASVTWLCQDFSSYKGHVSIELQLELQHAQVESVPGRFPTAVPLLYILAHWYF